MKLNSIQLAGLQSAAEAISGVPSQESALSPALRTAFQLGQVYGRGRLARELLAEHRDSQVHVGANGPDCVATERPGACRCAICTQVRHGL